jgi:hypothetical protein
MAEKIAEAIRDFDAPREALSVGGLLSLSACLPLLARRFADTILGSGHELPQRLQIATACFLLRRRYI